MLPKAFKAVPVPRIIAPQICRIVALVECKKREDTDILNMDTRYGMYFLKYVFYWLGETIVTKWTWWTPRKAWIASFRTAGVLKRPENIIRARKVLIPVAHVLIEGSCIVENVINSYSRIKIP